MSSTSTLFVRRVRSAALTTALGLSLTTAALAADFTVTTDDDHTDGLPNYPWKNERTGT